jgi:hypothetical protein
MPFYEKQFKAAYILAETKNYIDTLKQDEQEDLYNLFKYNANFELISNFKLNSLGMSNKVRMISCVAQNIILRGCPTLAPKLL